MYSLFITRWCVMPACSAWCSFSQTDSRGSPLRGLPLSGLKNRVFRRLRTASQEGLLRKSPSRHPPKTNFILWAVSRIQVRLNHKTDQMPSVWVGGSERVKKWQRSNSLWSRSAKNGQHKKLSKCCQINWQPKRKRQPWRKPQEVRTGYMMLSRKSVRITKTEKKQ